VADRKKIGHRSTGQSPQWAAVPMEEEEEEKDDDDEEEDICYVLNILVHG